ncbi:MAG: hypothetical protein FWF53_08110 [Candidatus Azobacteroides sp.]|nr:hypothetical protein [Candidatus Azobacteroides sp.]
MNDLVPIFVVGFSMLAVYKVFELFAKRKERILLIEKLANLCENEEDKEKSLKFKLPFISSENLDFGYWPLRISLLLIGVGAGCLMAFFIQIIYFNGSPIQSYREWVHQFNDLLVLVDFASISFFGGIGLFIAYLLEQKKKAK